MEMTNSERMLIREILMAELEAIPHLAEEANKQHGITFPPEVADALVAMRIDERNGDELPVMAQYGLLLGAAKQANNGTGWPLGITAIREAIQVFADARMGLHEISREIGRKVLGLED